MKAFLTNLKNDLSSKTDLLQPAVSLRCPVFLLLGFSLVSANNFLWHPG